MDVIRNGFKVTAASEGSGSEGMPSMVHSTNFLIVDSAGVIRAIHHLEDPDLVSSIIDDVSVLLEG
jgi:hypothetical protein